MRILTMPVIGLPNAGKSTLINALLGQKINAVTHKKHTTRSIAFASKIVDDIQILFVDTPGFEKANTKLGSLIFTSMKEYLADLEEMLLIIDARRPNLESLSKFVPKSIVVINKIDLLRKPKLLPIIERLQRLQAKEVFLISAQSGDGLSDLFDYLVKRGNVEENQDEIAEITQDKLGFACECVREKILQQFHEEIPYKIWIEPKYSHVPKNSAWKIILKIVVPKQSYKPILLAKKGIFMKNIGIAARAQISAQLRHPGFLGLEVVVDKNLWLRDDVYQKLGWM